MHESEAIFDGEHQKQESARVAAIYEGSLVERYDRAVSHFFDERKRELVEASSLGPGDRVLVLACGTGRDFAPLLDRIGPKGKILGLDRSAAMLKRAEERVAEAGWTNVELVQGDLEAREVDLSTGWDAAVCTLSLSTMPGALDVYRDLVARIRPGGNVLVGDMQLASGWRALGNPISVALSRRFGGSHAGHARSRSIGLQMAEELEDVVRREFVFGAYFWCRGVKPGA